MSPLQSYLIYSFNEKKQLNVGKVGILPKGEFLDD